MKAILIIATIFFMSFSFNLENRPLEEAKDLFGSPSFEYECVVPNQELYMNVGVYGWNSDGNYYGAQTRNDTIIAFFKFDDVSEYNTFITKD